MGRAALWGALACLAVCVESIADTPVWPGPSFSWGTLPTGSNQWNTGQMDGLIGEATGTRAGCGTLRISYPEAFALQWGYGVRSSTVDSYRTNGQSNLVAFLNGPTAAHSLAPVGGDRDAFPPSNLYEPIWSAPGVVNPNNFWAVHISKMVETFAGRILTLEIWNEPDFLNPVFPWAVTQNGTSNGGDNWWNRPPRPAELKTWNGEVYQYVRLLHVSYEVAKHFAAAAGKTVYVAVGGLGYEGFMDAVCRLTEKDPAVTYPPTSDVDGVRTGCEWFDVTSLHYYPTLMFGTLVSNSDDFAFGLIRHKEAFQRVTESRGYTGAKAKEYIYTETGISSPAVGGKGGEAIRRGYMIKAAVLSAVHGIRQLHWFTALDGDGSSEFGSMGLFQAQTNPQTPQTIVMKDSTKAMWTVQRVFRVGDKNYDAAATAALAAALPASVRAFVFRGGATPERVTVLWVSTANRGDENAPTVSVALPSNNAAAVVATYDNVRTTVTAAGGTVSFVLGGTPLFVEEADTGAPTTATTAATTTATTATSADTTTTATTTVAGGTTTTTVVGGTTTTTVAGGTTTTVAGGTTTTVAGGTTTTVAGGTTTTVAGGTTTTVAGGTTTTVAGGTTTTVGGGTTTTTTAAGPCTPPPLGALPLEPCVLECCPAAAGRSRLVFRMTTQYGSWRCPAWLDSAAAAMGLARSSLKMCTHYAGSSIAELDMAAADANVILSAAAPPPIADIASVSEAATGRSVAVAEPFPWWIVVVIVVAVLLLAAALIVGCILYRRRSKNHSIATTYVPLNDVSPSFSSAPQASKPKAAASGAVPFRLRQDVVDVGEGILPCRAGDICFVERSDLASTADWQYVQCGTKHGYVPRLLLDPA